MSTAVVPEHGRVVKKDVGYEWAVLEAERITREAAGAGGRGVFHDQDWENVDVSAYLEEGSSNVTWRHGKCLGSTWYIRGSSDVLLEDVEIGMSKGDTQVGSKYQSQVISRNITFRRVNFHGNLPVNPGDHMQALFCAEVDGLVIDSCSFSDLFKDHITAFVFFTAVQNTHTCSNVQFLNNHVGPNAAGQGISWGGDQGVFDNYEITGNLFESSPLFGTLKKVGSNFHVGVNYGVCSQNQHDYAVSLGVKFDEFPFRPASEWPGGGVIVPPPPPPDTLPVRLTPVKGRLFSATWEPLTSAAGYVYSVNGLVIAHTWDATRSSTNVTLQSGSKFTVQALLDGPSGSAVAP